MISQEDFILLMIVLVILLSSPLWVSWSNILTDKLGNYIRENAELED